MPGSVGRLRSGRRLAVAAIASVCAAVISGCGEPAAQEGRAMPPPEFAQKLIKEHPELFKTATVSKSGRKSYGDVDIRERREIIRREWEKSQGQSQ
jgi:hypothetical protein